MNVKRNKISKKTRLFSSKNRCSSIILLPTKNRPKTGITRKLDLANNKKSPPKKICLRHSTSNIYIDFKEGLDFRSVGPKSRIQDKVFNSYWEIKLISPKTILKKNMYEDTENNKNNVFTQKTMQEKMQLYKFPQINWRNKNPNNFLSHIGGNEFNISQTMSKNTTRPGSTLTRLHQHTSIFQKIKNRPGTSLNRVKEIDLKRPSTAIRKRKPRPRTAFSPFNKKINNENILFDDINDNTNNINVVIPEKIKNKFEKKIENDYNYKDDFFNQITDNENLNGSEEVKYIIKEQKKEINKKKEIKKYPNYESLIKGFQDNHIKNYSIKTDQADIDLLDLFDRSQKTNAATKAKDVNSDYW